MFKRRLSNEDYIMTKKDVQTPSVKRRLYNDEEGCSNEGCQTKTVKRRLYHDEERHLNEDCRTKTAKRRRLYNDEERYSNEDYNYHDEERCSNQDCQTKTIEWQKLFKRRLRRSTNTFTPREDCMSSGDDGYSWRRKTHSTQRSFNQPHSKTPCRSSSVMVMVDCKRPALFLIHYAAEGLPPAGALRQSGECLCSALAER